MNITAQHKAQAYRNGVRIARRLLAAAGIDAVQAYADGLAVTISTSVLDKHTFWGARSVLSEAR